jgi:hypothetical protein
MKTVLVLSALLAGALWARPSRADHYTRCVEYGDPVQSTILLEKMPRKVPTRYLSASSSGISYVDATRCQRFIVEVKFTSARPSERNLVIDLSWPTWIGNWEACEKTHESYGVYADTGSGYERLTESFMRGHFSAIIGSCEPELYSTWFAPAYTRLFIENAPYDRYIITAQADYWHTEVPFEYKPVTVNVQQHRR